RAEPARPARSPRQATRSRLLIPAVALRMSPGAAGAAVPALDVAQAPADLGGGVGGPVGAGGGHLGAGEGLRDAVGARRGVVGVPAPVGLAGPQRVEAAELVGGEAELREQRAGDV